MEQYNEIGVPMTSWSVSKIPSHNVAPYMKPLLVSYSTWSKRLVISD